MIKVLVSRSFLYYLCYRFIVSSEAFNGHRFGPGRAHCHVQPAAGRSRPISLTVPMTDPAIERHLHSSWLMRRKRHFFCFVAPSFVPFIHSACYTLWIICSGGHFCLPAANQRRSSASIFRGRAPSHGTVRSILMDWPPDSFAERNVQHSFPPICYHLQSSAALGWKSIRQVGGWAESFHWTDSKRRKEGNKTQKNVVESGGWGEWLFERPLLAVDWTNPQTNCSSLDVEGGKVRLWPFYRFFLLKSFIQRPALHRHLDLRVRFLPGRPLAGLSG